MTDKRDADETRRTILKITGSSVILLPIAALTGCSPDEPEAPPRSTNRGPEPVADDFEAPQAVRPPPDETDQTAAGDGELVPLEEDEPQAEALAYHADATTVDSSQHPVYQQGQICGNCVLFQPDADASDEWGGCALFPGKLVKTEGWCASYVAQPAA